jgi:hypothetical protein
MKESAKGSQGAARLSTARLPTRYGVRVIAPSRNEKLIGVVTAVTVSPPADVEVKQLILPFDESSPAVILSPEKEQGSDRR